MNKKFTKLMAALALLVGLMIPLGMWGQTRGSYTITFNGTNSESTVISTSTSCSSIVTSESASYLSGNVATATKAYGATSNGVKLGTSSAAGALKMNLSSSGQVTPTTIVVQAKRYNTSTSATLSVNGATTQTVSNSSNFNDYTFDVTSAITYLQLNASKYIWVKSITVNYGSSASITINNPTTFDVDYNDTDYHAFSGTYSGLGNNPSFGVKFYSSASATTELTGDDIPTWIYVNAYNSNGALGGNFYALLNEEGERHAYFKVYSGETYSTNVITVNQEAAPAPSYTVTLIGGNTISADYQGNVTSGTITVSTDLTGEVLYDIEYYDNGTYSSTTNPYSAWLVATVNNNNQIVFTTLGQNLTGSDRSAQFRVYATNYDDDAYSEVITLTQAAQPQVATPTFSPAAGAVASGTQVTITCATTGATIQYSTDGTNYSNYTNPIEITAETTFYAKATATGYADSQVASAHYTIRGNAEFVNGIYSEPFDSQASFDKWSVYSVSGDETWEYTNYGAYIKGNSNNNEDWLISPKMAVDNGNLYISFDCVGRYGNAEMITVLYSTDYPGSGNPTSYTWTALTTTPDIPYSSSNWNFESVSCNISATTDVYFAFKYTSTTSSSGTFEMKPFTASQCHTLTVSNLVGVNTFVFAGSESETLFEGEGSAPVGVGVNVMVSVDVIEGYDIQSLSLLVNGVEHVGDIDGGMYLFDMPNQNVTIKATATRLPYHTVTFTTNGITDVTMEVNYEQAIGTQPEANEAYIPDGFEFVGWYTDDYENMNTAPNCIPFPYTPTSDVTLKAVFAEVVTPATPDTWTLITDLSQVTTAGTYALLTENYYAFNGNLSNKFIGQHTQSAFSFTNGVATSAPEGTLELTLAESGNGFTMYNATKGYLYAAGAAKENLKWHDSEDSYWSYYSNSTNSGWKYSKAYSGSYAYLRTLSSDNTFRVYGNMTNQELYMAKKTPGTPTVYENYRTSLTESCTLTITGYNNNNDGGWNLIASPVTMTPSINDIITDTYTGDDNTQRTYDLYYFDQTSESEWKNYRQNSFNLVPGKGYLYANKTGGSYTLTGTPYSGNGVVTLDYFDSNPSENMRGLNLIGNPYNANTTIDSDREFYIMNSTGTQIIVADNDHKTIAPMQGIFVKAEGTGETVTFTPATQGSSMNNNSSLVLNLIQNRGDVIDRAIVRLGNGGTLPKIQLFENSTKLYISQYNEDYAVVKAEAQGEMPVNFRASENDTYTLNMNVENVDMNYLHLIDNMTGMDIDLLQTPSYTFEANTNDYVNRFKLVFAANGTDEADESSFAFFSNGNLIVNNEGNATLQVIDINGRILSSETISGSCSKAINATTGVYMLRLINGDNVKVQKVVVR